MFKLDCLRLMIGAERCLASLFAKEVIKGGLDHSRIETHTSEDFQALDEDP